MNIKLTLFRSKVARRMFVLFMVSAIAPLIILASLTYNQVTTHITKQTQQQLHQTSKSIGLKVFQRLSYLNDETDNLRQQYTEFREDPAFLPKLNKSHYFKSNFIGLGIFKKNNSYKALIGQNLPKQPLEKHELKFLNKGGTLLKIVEKPSSEPILLLRKALHKNNSQIHFVTLINPSALWNFDTSIPDYGEVCIFAENTIALYCSTSGIDATLVRNQLRISNPSKSQFHWNQGNTNYAAYSWSIFLDGAFNAGEWTTVLSAPTSYVYKPLIEFKKLFPPIIVLSILLVAFLSSNQIRKSLIPLEKLKDATKTIAAGNFTTKVTLHSNDEFEELADSFNHMAEKIEIQFTSLNVLSEVDRLMLSSIDTSYILETALERIKNIARCDEVLLFKINQEFESNVSDNHVFTVDKSDELITSTLSISENDRQILEAHPQYLFSHNENNSCSYLNIISNKPGQSFIQLPILIKDTLYALLILRYKKHVVFSDYDVHHTRELADRVAVAIANADWEEKVHRQAYYDTLTNLPNRTLLTDRLDQAVQRARRDGTQVAILLIDLDRFKAVNDSLGHDAGDSILKIVSSRLKKHINTTDTLVRYGGDKFVIIMPDIKFSTNSLAVVSPMSEKLLDTINTPVEYNNHEINLSASIGISLYPADSRTPKDLLKYAESAMYHAKSNGKGHFEFYSKDINATSIAQLVLENDLKHALTRDELEVFYQPQFDLLSSEIIGAEALIRWNHPKLGLLSPARFLPLAENTGLNVPLGNWVINQVCKQLRIWLDQNLSIHRIAVNLSAHHFKTQNLTQFIQEQLNFQNLSTQYLELEITEDTIMADLEKTIGLLSELKRLGVHLAIDDFGTGYSSLNYLAKFPIDYLKIDQTFTQEILSDSSVKSIVSAIVAMAHSMNLKVIAEGVETEEQLEFLRTLRCDIVQGYLISKPLPAEEFSKLVSDVTPHYIKSRLAT